MVKKISPSRRRSIAVAIQNQSSIVPKARRRAHSIVPGAALSPLAKARRSLAPRKSILKASVNILKVDSQSQSIANSQSATIEDTNATRSMDVTQDYTTPVHDNTSRKSLGRRVSFASHSYVRMFETNHTNSTGSPQSSPTSVSASPDGPTRQPNVTNENDYPRQSSHQRRSSVRYSLAQSEDMDLTSVIPGTLQTGSAILDEDFGDYDDENDYDNVDMDVTEAIRGDFARKRSPSLGIRQPLSQIPSTPASPPDDADQSQSDIGNESTQSDATFEQSQPMEFTVPLGQSLRPADQDQVWLALKQATHSGNDASEPELSSDDGGDEMNLDDAMLRLRRARDSMSLPQDENHESQDDSFTSADNSFEDDENKTMNLSRAFGRPSMAQGDSRLSMGYQDSNMDESEVYGVVVPAPHTPRQSIAPSTSMVQPPAPQQPPTFSVFHPPPSNEVSEQPVTNDSRDKATVSVPFSFTPKVPSPSKSKHISADSPSKGKPKPIFSAAFAPPVVRPSPKKAIASTEPRSSPNKRPRSTTDDVIENQDVDKPSPAKRQALIRKSFAEQTSNPQPTSTYKPKPLSPSKKAPFQPPSPVAVDTTSRPSSALRRPSGYYVKRKSLAVGFAAQSLSGQSTTAAAGTSVSPKKKLDIGLGRASLGSGASDAWARFNKDAGQIAAKELPTSKIVEKAEVVNCVREVARQASASPSPTRGSPAPIRTLAINSVALKPRVSSVEPEEPLLEPAQTAEPQEIRELSSTMAIDVEATQQWREGVQQSDQYEDDAVAISVAQFFSMTGIKFMDELTAPRRSIHPSQQPIRQPRNESEIPLSEYVTAMAIDIPQLVLYSRVSKDLEGWMAKRKAVFAQVEEEAAKVTPELFVEYARADEEGQAELVHQLNLIRTNTRYSAKSDWYDWKLQWVEGLRVTAEEAFKSLENDAHTLEELIGSADGLIPELEQEYQRLTEELEREQAEVAEIEGSDQDYLNELKATVAEQNIEIEALKAELSEGKDQLRWLQERIQELDAQKREAKNTITTAERILHRKKNSTRSEVFRLKAELEALEDLHNFRITKVNADLFEYVYASLFHVSIPCKNFIPKVSTISITRYGKASTRSKDDFPKLSAFFLKTAQWLVSEGDKKTVREIIHCLGDYWSSCTQLRSQFTLLSIKYPVEIIVPQPSIENPGPRFEARTTVLFPSMMGKAFISFVFSFDTFHKWPTFIDTLDCKVDIAYGLLDPSAIMKAVMERLSQASPSDNYACLLNACIEAQNIYL